MVISKFLQRPQKRCRGNQLIPRCLTRTKSKGRGVKTVYIIHSFLCFPSFTLRHPRIALKFQSPKETKKGQCIDAYRKLLTAKFLDFIRYSVDHTAGLQTSIHCGRKQPTI